MMGSLLKRAKLSRKNSNKNKIAANASKGGKAQRRPPRIDMGVIAHSILVELLASFRAKADGVHNIYSREDRQRLLQQRRILAAEAKKLDWSPKRMANCKKLVSVYMKDPKIRTYVNIRRRFPELKVSSNKIIDIDSILILENEFKKQGVDPVLVEGAVVGGEDGIDALCLHILELIILKEEIPKEGIGSLQRRRAAVGEAMINYLILAMMESIDFARGEIHIPESLTVLIRHHLCGELPDLHATYQSRQRMLAFIDNIADERRVDGTPSIRNVAKLASVSKTTAARWFADHEFKRRLELARKP